jgi:signal transduction histidine kinase
MSSKAPSLVNLIGGRMLVITLVWLALMIAFVQSEVDRSARELRLEALTRVAGAIADSLVTTPEGGLRHARRPGVASIVHVFAVRAPDGELIDISGPAAHALPPPVVPAIGPGATPEEVARGRTNAEPFGLIAPGGGTLNGVTLWVDTPRGAASVQVAEDLSHEAILLDDLVNGFFKRVGWILIPGVALLFVVTLLTIRVELKPVEHVADVATTIGPHTTGVRLPDKFIPREVMPLIESFNQALDRVERTLQAQREFAADAAHELRTPLAVMRAQLDALPPGPAVAELGADIAAMSRLVQQLLRLAEAEHLAVPPDSRADLAAVASEVAHALAPLASTQGRALALEGAERAVPVIGIGDALRQAVRNLVENALKHAPNGTTVEIRVHDDGRLAVRDHGPGVAAADRPDLFRRFWRKDRRDGRGAGLGLAIVAKIVEAHGGRISVDDAEGGGAVFTLALRPAPQDQRDGARRFAP